jgi:uncharacterized caspase-like protein
MSPPADILRRIALAASTAAWALLLTACATGPGANANAKLALVIGNFSYQNVTPLTNPVNDAADMCAALGKLGFRTQCVNNIGDRTEFAARVKEYVDQLGPDSVGVFYYAGHAVQAGNTNFLLPTNVQLKAAIDNPLRSLYSVDDLFESLGVKQTKFQLVILDACRNDLFASAPSGKDGRGIKAEPPTPLARTLKSAGHASYGLAPIRDAPRGTMVLYATASKDGAYDGQGRNGPLTKHILLNIGIKGLPVEEFVKRVTSGVEEETRDYGKRQTPYIYGSFSGKFCFAGCAGESSVPPAF